MHEMAVGSRVTFGDAQSIAWSQGAMWPVRDGGKDLARGLWCRPWIQHLEGVRWSLELG